MISEEKTAREESIEGKKGTSWFNPEVTDEEKGEYLSLAYQLCYPKEVVDALNKAKTASECERIRKSARRKY